MFAVLYSFEIHQDRETQFIAAWKSLTDSIRKHEGGLGSRLHQVNDNEFIAYAQWPDRETWDGAGKKLPEEALEVRDMLRECCINMKTVYELPVVEDLLNS